MNLSAIQTFLTILEAGSLVKASERLHVTQSTVTARLKTLETELGQTLVRRDKTGATPTAAGLRLKRYAETMTDLWRQARQETALPSRVETIFNLGCHPDLWPCLGRRLFDEARRRPEDVAASIWTGGDPELARWLASGLADVALAYAPIAGKGRVVMALPPDRLTLYSTSPDAPVRFDPGYVFVESGEAFGRWHAAEYADATTARLSFGAASLALDHILAEGGSAYAPARIAAPLVAGRTLFEIADAPVFERPAFLSYNEDAARAWPWFGAMIDEIGAA